MNGRVFAGARALYRAAGVKGDDMGKKPIIAIANSFDEFLPGHVHLNKVGRIVSEAIKEAGGIPREFNTMAVDDGIAMGHTGMLYSLPSRDIIADTVEYQCNAHCADALICIPNCDKVVPGMPMAALPPNIPTVFAPGGPMEADRETEAMARFRLDQIPDGACIQLGIGGVANAGGYSLTSKNDLGCHTEVMSDSIMALMKAGVINNSRPKFIPGKTVVGFAFGSKDLYEYLDHNEDLYFAPFPVINNPVNIAKNDNMISINAAVEVDLFGQVCAESVGTKHMSGSGGQIDYVRGACQSRGGKSFIAFTSTAKGGTISKIKSILPPGAVVTTSKNDVDYIVTEYGVAHLRGRSLGERARQLIAIAHPDFRDELTFEAKKRGIMI